MLYRLFFLLLLFAVAGTETLSAQSAHKYRRDGDLMYDQREYRVAEESYRKAYEAEPSAETSFNLGSAIYSQERYDEAVRQYESAIQKAADPGLKADAWYNLGNTYMNAGQLDKSIESYIESLKIRPEDIDTKKNLTLALQQLSQQQQQQQQQQQEGEQQDENEQQEQQQEQQQQQQNQQQQQSGEQDSQDQESQAQPPPGEELSRQEAEELLRIINSEDEKVQEKLRKGDRSAKKPKKDW